MPGTTNNSKPNDDPTPRPTQTEIITNTMPKGFGGFAERHYQDLFEDEYDYTPNYNGVGGGLGRSSYRRSPFVNDQIDDNKPYPDTVIFFHHNKQGINFTIHAPVKVFLVFLVVIIVFLNSPGIGDIVGSILKTVMNAR